MIEVTIKKAEIDNYGDQWYRAYVTTDPSIFAFSRRVDTLKLKIRDWIVHYYKKEDPEIKFTDNSGIRT